MDGGPIAEVVRTLSKAIKSNQIPSVEQLLLIFVLGGSVVLMATVAGKITQNPYISGILICFPAMVVSGTIAFHITGASPTFISQFLLGTIPGLVVVTVFSLVGHFSTRQLDFWPGLIVALLAWLIAASIAVALRASG